MFKDYVGIFKSLRDMQDQLWKDSMASFPGSVFPSDMNNWQQKTFENVNALVERAVSNSLEVQREWLGQWAERAGEKNLKPKAFAGLSAEAMDSTQRWLDNQNQLWDQWLQVVRSTGSPKKQPDFQQWETAVKESFGRQMDLLNEWSEMADVKKLSVKEVGKLSGQIEKAMEKAIKTQQRMWSHWFDNLGGPWKVAAEVAKPAPKAAKAAPKTAAKAAKPAAKKTSARAAAKPRAASKAPDGAHSDLKKIAGIGPGLEKKLKDSGIHTLHQIAELSDADIAHLEGEIIKFSGRISRDKWVEQAKHLDPKISY